MSKKLGVQGVLDTLGPEMLQVSRYFTYFMAAYCWLMALFAPLSEYCYLGPWKWFKLWQKLLFSGGCLFGGYGWWSLGQSLQTSREKLSNVRAA